MRVKKTDGVRTFYYKGSLEHNISLCEKEIKDKEAELPLYTLIFEKAKRELESKQRRIQECKDFIYNARTYWIPERDKKAAENKDENRE